MYSERMQVRVTPRQRQRLEEEAQRTGASIASLVRDAVDARFSRVMQEDRRRAWERIEARRADLPPSDELQEIIDSQFDDELEGSAHNR